MAQTASHARQMVGSLLVALAIVVATIVLVTARLGTTSVAELEARQERLEERNKAREERREERLERREDRREGAVRSVTSAPRLA
jgi:hypothetical protein